MLGLAHVSDRFVISNRSSCSRDRRKPALGFDSVAGWSGRLPTAPVTAVPAARSLGPRMSGPSSPEPARASARPPGAQCVSADPLCSSIPLPDRKSGPAAALVPWRHPVAAVAETANAPCACAPANPGTCATLPSSWLICVPLLRAWVCSVSISPEYGCPVTGIMRNIPGARLMLLVVATRPHRSRPGGGHHSAQLSRTGIPNPRTALMTTLARTKSDFLMALSRIRNFWGPSRLGHF